MKKLTHFFKDRTLVKYSFFIVLTGTLLYLTYFILKNFASVTETVGSGLSSVTDAIMPLIIGLIIAYIFCPMVDTIHNKLICRIIPDHKNPNKQGKRNRAKRILSVLISYLLIIAAIIVLVYGFISMILGELVMDNLPKLFDNISHYVTQYTDTVKSWINDIPSSAVSEKLKGAGDGFLKWIASNFDSSRVLTTIKNIGSNIATFIIGIIISIYLVYDKNYFISLWHKLLNLIAGKSKASIINENLNEVNGVVSNFLRGMLLDALIVSILSSIGLTLLGLKFAVFIGIFAGIFNIIPYFGPILGMLPAFLVGTMTDSLTQGLLAVLVLLIIQQIDGNIIYPKVVGSSMGLHPLFVLLAVIIGGTYGGLMGMIIAVPIASVIQIFVKKLIAYKEKKLSVIDHDIES